jgi:spermidine synthase
VPTDRAGRPAVYGIVLLAGTAGLGYELALGAAESFLLGDPVVQFTLIVGIYMAALGLGAYLSGLLHRRLRARCVDAMLATALLGGGSVPILVWVFSVHGPFRTVVYVLSAAIGILVGVQLPLLMRIVAQRHRSEEVIAKGLALDYAGALLGSLGFSLVLMPWLGLVRTTLVFGALDAVAAGCVVAAVGDGTRAGRLRLAMAVAVLGALIALIVLSARIEALADAGA